MSLFLNQIKVRLVLEEYRERDDILNSFSERRFSNNFYAIDKSMDESVWFSPPRFVEDSGTGHKIWEMFINVVRNRDRGNFSFGTYDYNCLFSTRNNAETVTFIDVNENDVAEV